MPSALYDLFERLPLAGPLFQKAKYPLKRVLRYYLSPETRRAWDWRIREVVGAPDNAFIPRVQNAGRIVDGYLIMHNGIRIVPDSYCGEPMRLMLEKNRGVHEPQEERVFMEVLKHLSAGAQIIELGANWAFYSMWFHRAVGTASCLAVEPNFSCLEHGRRHFALNDLNGEFVNAFVGAIAGAAHEGLPVESVDHLIAQRNIKKVDVLHADIQGAELEMLTGAEEALRSRKIDYIFISTHSNELHEKCRAHLLARNYTILADANLDETFSYDGLLVARRSELPGLGPVPIARKKLSPDSARAKTQTS
jgi:hypothetical protein